jgi:inhibitor of cysteine peptidase
MEVEINEEDNEKDLRFIPGQRFKVILSENPTAGFGWELAKSDDQMVKLIKEEFIEKSGEILGQGGIRTFVFLAKKFGFSELVLKYKRPWISSSSDKTLKFRIHIS